MVGYFITLGVVQVVGKVVETLPSIKFIVELQPSKQLLRCSLCGKMIKHKLIVIVGDVVTVEVNSMDLSMGRITFRWKPGQTPQLQGASTAASGEVSTTYESVEEDEEDEEEEEEIEKDDESEEMEEGEKGLES